ncbi:MAG: ferrous iron transport protein B [Desulfobacterales bacterium]|nr:ferrous iron transport protein B [Desulfobacterales bacterium]
MHDHGHDAKKELDYKDKKNIILIGNPNVGKSVIFGLLTGKYVTVSNYPGTTVEVSKAFSTFDKEKALVIDTPGTNSLLPQSEDERVTRDILLNERPEVVIQVADSKNMRRSLSLSLQLAEMEVPFVVDLNMVDEARSRGIYIDQKKLAQVLGVPVVPTVATRKQGLGRLVESLSAPQKSSVVISYEPEIEEAIRQIMDFIPKTHISARSIAVMFLAGESGIEAWLASRVNPAQMEKASFTREGLQSRRGRPISYILNQQRMAKVDDILAGVLRVDEPARGHNLSQALGRWAMHPVWGVPILLIVLYITYKIVGEFAAGTSVDFLESVVFGEYINPLLSKAVNFLIPIEIVRELLIGEYGLITMALTYAIAIVLPIVGFFFLIFGLMEDSGYLPRLAIMVNKLFKVMGLNGTAVLPMILGLGCDTMATLTARILPSKKERIIVTMLLALAVPCSAQLGVIFGGTATISPKATLIWAGVIIGVIFVVGALASLVLPGTGSDFILETPPIRLPKISNIAIKTLARVEWYLKEAVPLFILGTFILFLLQKLGLLGIIENAAAPVVVNLLGLPKDVAGAFVMGFLRRDYAAVLIVKGGSLDPIQMLVALVTITLFVPCIANFFIMIKERGMKTALLIVSFIFTFAFLFGGAFNYALRYLAVRL